MKNITYESISIKNIEVLIRNGCRAEDWSRIFVADGFDPVKVVNTVFKGTVKIGSLKGEVETHEGFKADSSISGASFDNVTIGNNCHIRNIHSQIQNMDIGNEVLIVNVGRVVCTEETTFGNGHEIDVLNEAGGRELKITAETSAQMAYMTVLYRDRKKLIEKLHGIADAYADSVKASRGYIGDKTEITNSGRITNVLIGEKAFISGISSLKEGTILSTEESPTLVLNGVTASNFVFQEGAVVKDRAVLSSVLVGQASTIGSQFAAENSVFFANSEGYHSEACSVFAGPYTVTHHKSTLLIAGLFSFYNAGSGTNQSNHMYKLGPVHEGILERGCKTGSFSYLLWPSRVGPFSAILGKHYANFDTSDFPFSYIDNDGSKSTLVPGMNFFTVGTIRDEAKWPTRDKRTASKKKDLIIFNVLSPYTGQKMIRGYKVLTDLYENTEKSQDSVMINGINCKRLVLRTSRRYYLTALDKYIGDVIIKRAAEKKPDSLKELFVPDPDGADGTGEWIDVCGLLCNQGRVISLIEQIEKGEVDSVDSLYDGFMQIYDSYEADEWNWILANYGKIYETDLADTTKEGLEEFLGKWKKSSIKIYNMVLNDAGKEFEGNVRIGFGIDGNKEEDFEAVRGTFEDNSFVKQMQKNIEEVEKSFKKVMELL